MALPTTPNVVLYIVSTLRDSGPVRVVRNIASNLDRNIWRPVVLTLSPERSTCRSSLHDFEGDGIDVVSLALPRAHFAFRAWSRYRTALNELRPAIVHTHGLRAELVALSGPVSVPRLVTIHNCPWDDYPISFGATRGRLIAASHGAILAKYSHRIACSASVASALARHGLESRTVANGVDLDVFGPVGACEKAALRRRLRLHPTKTVFVSTGHLSTLKDPMTVARGFLSATTDVDAELVFLGDGALYPELADLARERNSIKVLGRVPNVHEYLKAADYYISASRAEGLPNSVIEALASGLPAILSSIGPHEELLRPEAKAGTVFQVGRHEQLAEALRGVVRGDIPTESSCAVAAVKGRFDARTMSKSYECEYARVLRT